MISGKGSVRTTALVQQMNQVLRKFRWPESKLRTRLFVAFVLMVIGSEAAITGFSLTSDWRGRQDEVEYQLREATATRQADLDGWLNDLTTTLSLLFTERVMSVHIETVTTQPRESQAFRDSYAHLSGDFDRFLVGPVNLFDQVFVMDTHGRVVLATDPALEGSDQSGEAFFSEGLSQGSAASLFYSNGLNTWRWVVVYPVTNENGLGIGMVAGAARMDLLAKLMMAPLGLGDTGELYLVSTDERIITPTRGGNPAFPGRALARTRGVEETLRSRASSFQMASNYAGIPTLGYYVWMPRMNAVLVAEQTQAQAFASLNLHLITDLVVTLVVVLFTLLLMSRVVRTLTSPLAELTETATRIGAGDVEQSARVEGTDEIGALARAFNAMTAQLRSLIDRLKIQVAELEQARQRAEHLASFPQLNPTPVLELDLSGKITFSNPAAQKALQDLGMDPQALQAWLPADVKDILKEPIEKQSPLYREVILGDRIFGENISPALTFGTLRLYAFDITERKRMEGALRRARDELERRVQDRTAELVQINKQLSQEIAERTRAQEAEQALSASLEQRVADRTRELTALYGASSVASRAESLETLLDKSLALMVSAMHSLGSAVLLIDEAKDKAGPTCLRVVAQEGKPLYRMPRRSILPSEGGVADTVIRDRETLLIPDLSTDLRVPESMRRAGPRTLLLTPLKAEGRVLGIIGMMRDAGDPFSVEEVALLTTVAQQIGISMQRLQTREIATQNRLLEERQLLARQMHDSVTQSLYGLATLTEAAQGHLEAGDLPGTQRTLVRIGQTVRQALKEMRLFIFQLRPNVLATEGLIGALQFRLAAVEGRSEVRTHIVADETVRLPHSIENALYQIAQEALNNILRHANANSITIHLRREAELVVLEIADDGAGFAPGQIGIGGMGIQNMRDLASEIGGTLEIMSAPLKGTCVKVSVPA